MSQREAYREALAEFFGNKSLKPVGNDFVNYRKRNGDTACARFFAEADQIISILEALGLTFGDEAEDLLADGEPVIPVSKPGKKK